MKKDEKGKKYALLLGDTFIVTETGAVCITDGTQFTFFTGTKVHILTQQAPARSASEAQEGAVECGRRGGGIFLFCLAHMYKAHLCEDRYIVERGHTHI